MTMGKAKEIINRLMDSVASTTEEHEALATANRCMDAWEGLKHDIGELPLTWEYGAGVWDCFKRMERRRKEIEGVTQ